MIKKVLKYYVSLSLFTKFVSTSIVIIAVIVLACTANDMYYHYQLEPFIPLMWIISFWMLAIFLLSVLYTIIGIVRLIYEKSGKIKKSSGPKAMSMIIKGIAGIVLAFLFYSLFTIILNFFALQGGPLYLPEY